MKTRKDNRNENQNNHKECKNKDGVPQSIL